MTFGPHVRDGERAILASYNARVRARVGREAVCPHPRFETYCRGSSA